MYLHNTVWVGVGDGWPDHKHVQFIYSNMYERSRSIEILLKMCARSGVEHQILPIFYGIVDGSGVDAQLLPAQQRITTASLASSNGMEPVSVPGESLCARICPRANFCSSLCPFHPCTVRR